LPPFDEALKERTRDRVPLDWAATQANRGTALGMLGERESGTARLEQAVAAYDACLGVATSIWPPERVSQVRAWKDEIRAEIKRRMAKSRVAPLLVRLWRRHRD
jgi:hypothetical protein